MSSLSATTCARPRTSRSRSSTTSAPMSLSTRRPGGCCSATRQELGWTSTSARTPVSRPTGRSCAPTSTRRSAASRSGRSAARTSRRSSPPCTARACRPAVSGAPTSSSAPCSPRRSATRSSPSPRAPGIQLPGVVTAADFILPAHTQVEAVAAGLPTDWAATVWLMHGCGGLRIGEALAVNLRCRISKGKTLRVREQVNPNAQLRPLKFRVVGEFRDIPLPEYVSEAIDKHVAAHGTTADGGTYSEDASTSSSAAAPTRRTSSAYQENFHAPPPRRAFRRSSSRTPCATCTHRPVWPRVSRSPRCPAGSATRASRSPTKSTVTSSPHPSTVPVPPLTLHIT